MLYCLHGWQVGAMTESWIPWALFRTLHFSAFERSQKAREVTGREPAASSDNNNNNQVYTDKSAITVERPTVPRRIGIYTEYTLHSTYYYICTTHGQCHQIMFRGNQLRSLVAHGTPWKCFMLHKYILHYAVARMYKFLRSIRKKNYEAMFQNRLNMPSALIRSTISNVLHIFGDIFRMKTIIIAKLPLYSAAAHRNEMESSSTRWYLSFCLFFSFCVAPAISGSYHHTGWWALDSSEYLILIHDSRLLSHNEP